MPTDSLDRSLQQRLSVTQEVLAVWARAFGCSPDQVTETVARAGLPMEKLWNSINARTARRNAVA